MVNISKNYDDDDVLQNPLNPTTRTSRDVGSLHNCVALFIFPLCQFDYMYVSTVFLHSYIFISLLDLLICLFVFCLSCKIQVTPTLVVDVEAI